MWHRFTRGFLPFCCHPAKKKKKKKKKGGGGGRARQTKFEEWENDRETTLAYLESHGDGVFDSVVLSASRTGPVLKKTVLDYR